MRNTVVLNNKNLIITILSIVIIVLSAVLVIVPKKPAITQEEVRIQVVMVTEYKIHTVIRETPKRYTCNQDPECAYLAEAIYYEARGESLNGQIAVGWVIVNRANSKYFPDSIAKVVKQRCQFSYRCDGSMRNGIQEREAFDTAKRVAMGIILGIYEDPTNGANHYLNPDKVKRLPKWVQTYPKVATIGNHDFHVRR